MVVPVEEDDGPFVQHEEEGVAQLDHLGVAKKATPGGGGTEMRFKCVGFAQQSTKSVLMQLRSKGGKEPDSADDAEECEGPVPDAEQDSEVVGGAIAHPSLSSEDEDKVECGDGNGVPPVVVEPFGVPFDVEGGLKCGAESKEDVVVRWGGWGNDLLTKGRRIHDGTGTTNLGIGKQEERYFIWCVY